MIHIKPRNGKHRCGRLIAIMTTLIIAIAAPHASAQSIGTDNVATDTCMASGLSALDYALTQAHSLPPLMPDTAGIMSMVSHAKPSPVSLYEMAPSWTTSSHDWKRLWYNTIALGTAFVGTLLVLECLPEDATSWNRAELQDVPLFDRWYDHVVTKGVEWDHDKFYFNYILHPYAGATYFMAARSCGFNFWQSMLYCTLVSNVGWEYGIEAFMERPSIQDLIITPVVGSFIGEGFYRIKRHIVDHGYSLWGSPVLGGIVAFLVDPVNEFIGYLDRNPARRVARANRPDTNHSVGSANRPAISSVSLSPMIDTRCAGFALSIRL